MCFIALRLGLAQQEEGEPGRVFLTVNAFGRGSRCGLSFRYSSTKMVGTTGFEPATSRTPSVRATRLRHVPTANQIITGVRAASRMPGERRADPATLCG